MPEVKKHTIHRSKQRRNIKKMVNQDVVFITKNRRACKSKLVSQKVKKN